MPTPQIQEAIYTSELLTKFLKFQTKGILIWSLCLIKSFEIGLCVLYYDTKPYSTSEKSYLTSKVEDSRLFVLNTWMLFSSTFFSGSDKICIARFLFSFSYLEISFVNLSVSLIQLSFLQCFKTIMQELSMDLIPWNHCHTNWCL